MSAQNLLIRRKIIKNVSTRCHILKLKCTSAPQTPLLNLRVLLLREGRGRDRKEGEGRRKQVVMEENGRRGDGKSVHLMWADYSRGKVNVTPASRQHSVHVYAVTANVTLNKTLQ